MATAKPNSPPPSAGTLPPRRRGRGWIVWGLLALLALGAWYGRTLHAYAVTGAALGAHLGCSCRFIGGRALSDCRKDFEPGMGLVSLSEDEAEKSVTARFLVLSSQTATFREGQGCVLEPWKN